ncbi:hypothetical protein [Massilia yuzhufengensis]|uniref:Uncharacterized protein n=1 Tax=Massilia yuzhufengensis TaxID=1164594 RepID=A0A1I1DBD4_9BURK|nr:hypothetical protein [Massilia yuzhufengensis]SFB72127.1 hypothetical protein SAMN05216204_101114 [Massilia yuzhufengensis]
MSTTLTLLQTAADAISLGQVLRTATGLALLGGLGLFFRPLLVGIGRAAVLTVRPRPPKAQRLAERH